MGSLLLMSTYGLPSRTIRASRRLLKVQVHSKKKSTSEHLFWCFRLSQIEDSVQYLEGPNSTWKDHDRNQDSYHGPSKYHLVLPGTEDVSKTI